MNLPSKTKRMRSPRTSLIALIVVVAAVFPYSSACAQGTQGTLPKPITSRELESYAKRLVLSDQQVQALDPLHVEYREEFRQLRENDIQDFLDESAKLNSNMSMPKRETIEKLYKEIKRLSNKIKNLDNRFFSKLELLLDETQLTIMPRVRLARERARYRQGAMMGGVGFGNSVNVDLSQIYSKLNLSLDEAADTHSIIVHYEQQLTSSCKDLYEASISMMLDMIKAIEEMGLTDIDMSDPESMQSFMKAMQTIYAEVGKQFSKKSEKIGNLNNKTVKKIAELISPENARDLKQRYYRKAYPMASFDNTGSQMKFELALRYPDLSDEQRQLITDAAIAHQLAHDRITEEMVEFLEDFNKNRSMFDAMADQSIWKDYQEKISEFQTRRQELNKTANQSLDAQLGEELVAKINDPSSWAKSIKAEPVEVARQLQQYDDSDDDGYVESFVSFGGRSNRPMAGPINSNDIASYSTKLKLNDQHLLIVQELHQQYQEQYKQYEKQQREKLQEVFQELFANHQSGEIIAQSASNKYQDLATLQQIEKLKTLGEFDTAFLDDVQLLLDDTSPANALERIRLARKRILYEQNIEGSMGYSFLLGDESNESHVDLTLIIDKNLTGLHITNETDLLLFEYEKELTSEFAKRYDLAIQSQKRTQELMRDMMARQAEDEDNASMAINMEYTIAMQKTGEEVRKANKAIAKFNRNTFDELLATIDDSYADQLQRAYKRACYPNVYKNMNSGEHLITATKKMGDLTDEQRMSLNMFELEFQSQYEVLCDKMVEIYELPSSALSASFDDPEYMKEYMQQQQKLQVIQFDLNELNSKAKRKLRQILSPTQLERIGLRKIENAPG